MKKLAIVGSAAGGGAAQVIDAVRTRSDFDIFGVFDNDINLIGAEILGVKVVASSGDVAEYWKSRSFDEIVLAIGGDLLERQNVFKNLKALGIPFANVIDSTAQIRSGATIGDGNVLLANVFLGPFSSIGDNCYLITGTNINHHSIIGSHCYFSASCVLAGEVTVGDRVRFDTGSGAKARVTVPDDTFVAAGEIRTD